jgi:hypothetical protein
MGSKHTITPGVLSAYSVEKVGISLAWPWAHHNGRSAEMMGQQGGSQDKLFYAFNR